MEATEEVAKPDFTGSMFSKEGERVWAILEKVSRDLDKMKEQYGGISENLGCHAEQFFQDSLARSLTFGGEKYDYMVPNQRIVQGNKNIGEFDIMLVNGKSVAIIEVKNRIHPDFVKEMAEKRVALFRKYFTAYSNHKLYLGVAGFSFSEEVLETARECGIGIVKQVGDSMEIEAEHLKAY